MVAGSVGKATGGFAAASRQTDRAKVQREREITVEQYSEYFYLCTVKCHEVVIVQALKIAEARGLYLYCRYSSKLARRIIRKKVRRKVVVESNLN